MPPEAHVRTPRRRLELDLVDLPFGIRAALKKIVAEMRDIPRDVIFDRAELVHWVNRMARRVEGIERTKVPAERPTWNAPKPLSKPPAPTPSTSEVERVFGSALTTRKRNGSRTITSRKGKSVKVETLPGQLPLFGFSP